MKKPILLILLMLASGFSVAHPCEKKAITQAYKLLAFNSNNDSMAEIDESSVKELPRVRNPSDSKTYFDVIEVRGSVYKGEYRMRFLYYRGDGQSCLRVGQEILELVSFN